MSSRSRPQEETPTENLTPTVRGSQEFVLGAVYMSPTTRALSNKASINFSLRAFVVKSPLGTGHNDVVRRVYFPIRAEGAKEITVLLAVVLVWTMPRVDTNHTRQIA